MRPFVIVCLFVLVSAVVPVHASEREAVAGVLESYHRAASEADAKTYLGLMADNSVFIGTDATERWPKQAFAEFVNPRFQKGQGWTYTPIERNVDISPDGKSAWFDELLEHDRFGLCRSTGVLIKTDSGWKIAQYQLTFPVPNDVADDVLSRIKAFHEQAKTVKQ